MANFFKLHPRYARAITVSGVLLIIIVVVLAIRDVIPVGDDWRDVFHGLPFMHPYAYNDTRPPRSRISYPPWVMLFLPHAQLDVRTGNAINFLLNLIVPLAVMVKLMHSETAGRKKRSHLYTALFLTFTSPFYLQLVATNNVEWIPLLAFLMPEVLAGVFLTCKPQAIGGAFLIFIKHTRGRALIPLLVLIVLSFVLWPGWVYEITPPPLDVVINIAPFPLLVPLGIYFLWRAWKEDDQVLAASATPFLVPYMTPYAAAANMVLIAVRYQKIALIIWIVMWVHVGIGVRQVLF